MIQGLIHPEPHNAETKTMAETERLVKRKEKEGFVTNFYWINQGWHVYWYSFKKENEKRVILWM